MKGQETELFFNCSNCSPQVNYAVTQQVRTEALKGHAVSIQLQHLSDSQDMTRLTKTQILK